MDGFVVTAWGRVFAFAAVSLKAKPRAGGGRRLTEIP